MIAEHLEMDAGLREIALEVELGLRAREPELEVAIEVIDLVAPGPVAVTPEEICRAALDKRRAAALISPAPGLDDEWFGGYDASDPSTHPIEHDASAGTLQRLARWIRRGRA